MNGVNCIMQVVNAEAEQAASSSFEPYSVLKSIPVKETEWNRQFMKGRFTKAPPQGF